MPVHPPESADSRFLHILAESLSRALADNGPALVVHVAAAPEGPEVGVLPLDGRSPSDVLLGSAAPEHWWAMGVAARGSTRTLGRHGSVAPCSGRAEAVVLVHRDGEVVSRVQTGRELLTDPPASGTTLDCLQRALGLPTAAPEEPTSLAFAQLWLDHVIAAGRRGPTPLSWPQVADLHPARQLLATENPHDPTDVVVAAKALGRVCDWDQLRWAVVEGRWSVPGLGGADAAWFDAGGFARWVVGSQPGLPILLDDVARVMGAATARRCARTLRQLELLGRNAWRPHAA